MKKRIWLFLFSTALLAADVQFEKPGLLLDAQPGNSRVMFQLPTVPKQVYERITIRFRMHIGKLQPVFNAFVDLTRKGEKNFFAMQIRADKSKTLVDKMDHTQYGEVAPWKDDTDYRVQVQYDTTAGTITFDAYNADGSPFQHMVTSIAQRVLSENGSGMFVGFGLDKVYDHAYYPPWTWKFFDLSVTMTPLQTAYWKSTYTYKDAGALPLRADVYRTPDGLTRPVILWLHGGALIFGHRGNLPAWQAKRYVDAGYIVVAADYRLAPETKLPAILTDMRDAYQWIREKGPALYGADPTRVAVIGHSAGGYLTLLSGYECKPRPRVLVAFYGYGDIVGPWQTQPAPLGPKQKPVTQPEAEATVGATPLAGTPHAHERFRFYAYSRQQGIWPNVVTGMDPAKSPNDFREFCPLENVDAEYPATLLLHGDADRDVPFEQSELMLKQLTSRGVQADLMRIPGGPHVFDGNRDAPHVTEAFDRVLQFLSKNLE